MRHSDKLAPTGALAAALLSFSCCVPLGITAGLGLAGVSMFASRHQGWFMGASVGLLAVGFVQLARAPRCRRRSRTSIATLAVSAVVVAAVVLFPQEIAGFLADRLP